MSWFLRGVQSAIFHYVSCTPCLNHMDQKRRRREQKKDRRAREKLHLEQPDLYPHPGASGTNPYWSEDIAMGPGPPPQRAKRTNTSATCSQRGIATAGTQSSKASHAGSSSDLERAKQRLSQDTIDDDNWNRTRYQREDEDLWGHSNSLVQPPASLLAKRGLSFNLGEMTRTGTSMSSADSYYTARPPPVNDLHPPIVSNPSPRPSDNQWMLQPPPKASIMSGKERATTRSRSGSGASSRIEVNLQRQVSARQLQLKVERGQTPDMPAISRGNSYSDLIAAQRHDRPTTEHLRPGSAASSRKKSARRDAALSQSADGEQSSGDSGHPAVLKKKDSGQSSLESLPATADHSAGGPHRTRSRKGTSESRFSPTLSAVPSLNVVQNRSSRPRLSTVMSSRSGSPPSETLLPTSTENRPGSRRPKYSSTQSSDSVPYLMKHRAPLSPSDISSLNALQDVSSPQTRLGSRLPSSPELEPKHGMPRAETDGDGHATSRDEWQGSGFGISRGWDAGALERPVPFDSIGGGSARDPRMRWSVDF